MGAPLAWVRRISSEIPELQTIPLFGNAPPFDWDYFSATIGSRFGVPHLKVRTREQAWREQGQLKKGFVNDLSTLSINLSPLGNVYWMMSREDMEKLTSWLFKPGQKTKPISSEILQEGFYRFLAVEALDTIQEMSPLDELTLQLSEEEESFDRAFCIDIEIEIDQKSCWGRLAIPNDFRTRWVEHFSQMASEYVPSELSKQTVLSMGIKTGSVLLHQDDWSSINLGDFILLDRGSYDSHKAAGIAALMLHSTPIFNVKIKQDRIEIADYAFHHEENMDPLKKQRAESVDNLQGQEGQVVAIREVPLYVTVEIGRIKITLDELMHLTPGNTLELPIHPDQNVSLTVNGQKIGRAELVRLGEQLGIRILEIG